MPTYSVFAIYEDNNQRYATSVEASAPYEVAELALETARADNKNPDLSIQVCGVFEGDIDALDTYAQYASVAPRAPRASGTENPYTVVGMTGDGQSFARHVSAQSVELAEIFGRRTASDLVAGVISGHRENLLVDDAAPAPAEARR